MSRLIPAVIVATLLIAGLGFLALATPPPAAIHPTDPTRTAAPDLRRPAAGSTALGHRDPYKGASTPGAPEYRLTTTSMQSSNCGDLSGFSSGSFLPSGLAYDSADRSFWVAASTSCVAVLLANDTSLVDAAYPVGTDPTGVAVDPVSNQIYVTNAGSDNVTVLSGSTGASVANISVAATPLGITYDPASGDLFVASNISGLVSVIAPTTESVTATIPVGAGPTGVVADPLDHEVFATNRWSDNVSVLSSSTDRVIASIPAGAEPYGVAWDNATDTIYVTNEGSSNVSVLDAATWGVVTNIPVVAPAGSVGLDLQGIGYDANRQAMWVGGGEFWAVVLNTTSESVMWFLATDPSAVAVDNDTGMVCLTNTFNATVQCITLATDPGVEYGSSVVPVIFAESGLPYGTEWSVSVGTPGVTLVSNRSSMTFVLWSGWSCGANPSRACQYDYSFGFVPGFEPTVTNGTVNATGALVSVNVSFVTYTTYQLSFYELGLPAGTVWQVTLETGSGANYSGSETDSSLLWFAVPNGSYRFVVGNVPGYNASPADGGIVVDGAPANVTVLFTAEISPPTGAINFTESGLPLGSYWSVLIDSVQYSSTSSNISLVLPAGNYQFNVTPVSGYEASPPSGSVVVSDSYVIEVSIAFNPVPTYSVTFIESGLPSGSLWSVVFDGVQVPTIGASIVFTAPGGNHEFSVPAALRYLPTPSSGTIDLTSVASVSIIFAQIPPPPPPVFPVSFLETGLSSGLVWTVHVNGSTTPTSGVVLTFPLPNGSYPFAVSSPSGFVATPTGGSVQVVGGPVTIFVTFTAIPSSGSNNSGSISSWNDLAIVAAVGAAAGAVTGVIAGTLFSRKRPPDGRTAPPPPP